MNEESLSSPLPKHLGALRSLGGKPTVSRHGRGRVADPRDGVQQTFPNAAEPTGSGKGEPLPAGADSSSPARPDPADELRRAKEFSELVINSSVDGILAFDRDCRYTVWNPGMERITGMSADAVLGKCAFDVFPFLRQTREDRAFFATLAGCWSERTDRPFRIPETGREGFFEAHYSPLREPSGEIVGGLAIIRDITERKHSDERVLQAERLNAIAQMVTGMAHESRNALQRSQACLDVLSLKVQDRPEVHDLIARIQKAQDHLHNLYEEVRAYASPIKLEREYCNLEEMVKSAWNDVTVRQTNKKAATLKFSESNGEPRCHVDPDAMQKVFCNVLENSLAVSNEPVEIVVEWNDRYEQDSSALIVTLRDNGPGLTVEQQTKIFDPFYTTKTQGTGLGMAIAKRIVEAHGGRIVARPNTPSGAEIQITLPRTAT